MGELSEAKGFKGWTESHPKLWQFVKYALVSGLASAVEFAVFALLDFWICVPLRGIEVSWWIVRYGAESGGLCGLLATALSYLAAQAFNFVVQRKKTFHATNDPVRSGILFTVMIVIVWFVQIWFSGVLMTLFREPLGQVWGDLLAKTLNMTLSFLIQFPINKYIIMRGNDK